jgi:hypothetical protein
VLSFCPSLSLLVFFLAIFLECRVLAGRVTVPLRGFFPFFAYGCVGASLLSLVLQQIPLGPANANSDFAKLASFVAGPPIEELAKALPIVVLAFIATTWRRLAIGDLALAGVACGAGFGFVECNLLTMVNGTLPSSAVAFLSKMRSMMSIFRRRSQPAADKTPFETAEPGLSDLKARLEALITHAASARCPMPCATISLSATPRHSPR